MFPRIGRTDTLRNEVAEHIKGLVKNGQLKPGDRLPTEREMAQEFGVSRTVIRDAVKTLVGVGILEVKHGVGIFVGIMNSNTVARQLSSLLINENDTIENLFGVRMVLETAAAGWAAEKKTHSDLPRIFNFIKESKRLLIESNDLESYWLHDHNFHLLVAELSANPVAVRLMENLLDLLQETRHLSIAIPGRNNLSVEEHIKILEAILQGQAETARLMMQGHLDSVLKSIKQALDEGQANSN